MPHIVQGPGLEIVEALTVKARPADVPPPGEGLKTVTVALPAAAISDAGMAAASVVLLTKEVVRAFPPQRTTELLMKLEPFSVSVNADPPTVAELGAIPDRTGAGLGGGGEIIVKACAAEVPPPGAGLKTVTAAVPEETRSDAVMAAVSDVLLT